jgi:hypothetical protein
MSGMSGVEMHECLLAQGRAPPTIFVSAYLTVAASEGGEQRRVGTAGEAVPTSGNDTLLKALDAMLDSLTSQHARRIRERFGVGPQTAAVFVAVAGDNPERLKSEAA